MEYNDINDLSIALTKTQADVESLEKRMDKQDEFNDEMHDLVISVKVLAENMKNMLREQEAQRSQLDSQDKEIQEIKLQPVKRWDSVVLAVITSIIGGFAGYLVSILH